MIDTGSGMHPEVRSRAFEPFFSTKSSPRHLGLGLTRAYTIIEQSGGSIEIESAPGQGTLVRLLLPQAPAKQPAGTRTIPLEPFTPPAGQGRILVAEDEDSVRQLVCMTLTRFGYEVIEANSASAALSLLQDQIDKVDLILTDVMMPGMNGIELSREVRRKRPDLPVVYMSGYTEHTDLEPVRPGRKPILVRKPFGAAELCGVVNSVLENS